MTSKSNLRLSMRLHAILAGISIEIVEYRQGHKKLELKIFRTFRMSRQMDKKEVINEKVYF